MPKIKIDKDFVKNLTDTIQSVTHHKISDKQISDINVDDWLDKDASFINFKEIDKSFEKPTGEMMLNIIKKHITPLETELSLVDSMRSKVIKNFIRSKSGENIRKKLAKLIIESPNILDIVIDNLIKDKNL